MGIEPMTYRVTNCYSNLLSYIRLKLRKEETGREGFEPTVSLEGTR